MRISLQIADIFTNLFAPLHGHDPSRINQLPLILAGVVQMLLIVIGILAVIFVIVAGIQYATSEGDPGKATEAKDSLRNAIIGVILSASAFLIVKFLAGQFS